MKGIETWINRCVVCTYAFAGLVEDEAKIVNKVIRELIFERLELTLRGIAVKSAFKHGAFDLSLALLEHDEVGLLGAEPVGKGVRDVGFLQGEVVIEQVVDHRELQVLLELLERVRVLRLFVHQMADEVIVCLVQVAEVGDLLAQIVTLLLLQFFQRQRCLSYLIEYLLSVGRDQEVLDDLGAFLFRDFVNMTKKGQERVQIK